MPVSITAVIVSYNTNSLLRACLTSLVSNAMFGEPGHQIVVVDNCSNDGSRQMVHNDFPQVRLVENPVNVGFAAACNQGIERAEGDLVLILNPDTEVLPEAIEAMAAFLSINPRTAMVGPQLLNPDGTLQESCFRFPTLPMIFLDFFPFSRRLLSGSVNGRYPKAPGRDPIPVDHPLGACFLARRQALDRVGMFDDGFFMYCEEVDLCLRLRAAGWEVYHLPHARVIHHGGQSARQAPSRMLVELHRSRYRLFAKHYSPSFAATARAITRLGAISLAMSALVSGWSGELTHDKAQEKLAASLTILRM
jgi:N-acetylglucosaminyl-diphospho-decaprenol L-rhamnosyltransferase